MRRKKEKEVEKRTPYGWLDSVATACCGCELLFWIIVGILALGGVSVFGGSR